MVHNLYEVLGVAQNATQSEIGDAYRDKARSLHPDVNQGGNGSEETFKRIAEAYSLLAEEQSRGLYDRALAFFQEKRRRENLTRQATESRPVSEDVPRSRTTAGAYGALLSGRCVQCEGAAAAFF